MFSKNWRKKNFVAALTCLCLVTNLLGPNLLMANGPCSGANDAKGPCTDTGRYTSTGIGNGACGRCGPRVFTYAGGSCSGTSNSSSNDCNGCTTRWSTVTYNYAPTPVGSIAFAGCSVNFAACLSAAGVIATSTAGLGAGAGAICVCARMPDSVQSQFDC